MKVDGNKTYTTVGALVAVVLLMLLDLKDGVYDWMSQEQYTALIVAILGGSAAALRHAIGKLERVDEQDNGDRGDGGGGG
jgi:hypothetical protein